MILTCIRCQDQSGRGAVYQNQQYGHGKRVHNATETKGQVREYRCTICGSTRKS